MKKFKRREKILDTKSFLAGYQIKKGNSNLINNYKITIEYLGKGFVGWQIQKKGRSIQAIIESALTKVLKK